MAAEKVWTVERGHYSDHVVMCVTRTKKAADNIARLYNETEGDGYNDARVSTLPLISEPTKVTTYLMQTDVWDNGTTSWKGQDLIVREEWDFDMLWPEYAKPVGWRWVRAPIHGDKGGRLEVYGTDLERVRRVFSDRRAQLLADDAFRGKPEKRG